VRYRAHIKERLAAQSAGIKLDTFGQIPLNDFPETTDNAAIRVEDESLFKKVLPNGLLYHAF
jgi:hypothetical protein